MSDTEEIPYGFCKCGCGRKTNIAIQTIEKYGHVKGEPFRFCKGHRLQPTTQESFWSKVQKTNGCWLWTATKTNGYGMIRNGNRMVFAHRFSWELHNGPIPDGLCVLHNCPEGDNPACCNPAHLFLGTKADNNTDRKKKGRNGDNSGEKQGGAKLTKAKVLKMFEDRKNKMILKDIADKNEISITQASDVLRRESWKHLWK